MKDLNCQPAHMASMIGEPQKSNTYSGPVSIWARNEMFEVISLHRVHCVFRSRSIIFGAELKVAMQCSSYHSARESNVHRGMQGCIEFFLPSGYRELFLVQKVTMQH